MTEAVRRGTSPVVEIEIKTSTKADSLNVSLPTSSLKTLTNANYSSLVITSNVAEVTLDHTALSALANQATSNTVSLQIAPVSASALTTAQRDIVGNTSVMDLSMVSGRTVIHNYNNGVITVTLPYTLTFGQSAGDVVVYYLEDNATLTPCNTSYRNGKVTFTTTHLSKYVIGDKDLTKQQIGTTVFTDVPAANTTPMR